MVEMAIGKYPIPPPSPSDLASIFGTNAIEEHMEAARNGRALAGIFIKTIHVYFLEGLRNSTWNSLYQFTK